MLTKAQTSELLNLLIAMHDNGQVLQYAGTIGVDPKHLYHQWKDFSCTEEAVKHIGERLAKQIPAGPSPGYLQLRIKPEPIRLYFNGNSAVNGEGGNAINRYHGSKDTHYIDIYPDGKCIGGEIWQAQQTGATDLAQNGVSR